MFRPTKLTALCAAFTVAIGYATVIKAQETAPSRVRGTLTEVSPTQLKIRTRDGKEQDVAINKDTKVVVVTLSDIGAIKPDSYIGTAAAPQPDGSLKALEVHVFPSSMRGVGEGSTPWDLTPGSTMTNGAVGSIVETDGRVLTVKYGDSERKVSVPADVPVVSMEPADQTALSVGSKALLLAVKEADGSSSARFVIVGKNGLAPPM
ncbi:hypothetical protein QA644_33975 (plasmid) [Rhizobium sp. CC1099]|uniref:hypothetical protein n=1 Tax=Rhizobium sp. CC1099 TaxID=3039160 RepID=UPI0024B264D9|nr:hypothetical protein [Rhizobium sp. CC1099]WFU92199.1 hypothetical protein QA644_33975 [Rhizobium sp. CC1099]